MHYLYQVILILAFFHVGWLFGQNNSAIFSQESSGLGFIPNQGQIVDAEGKTRDDVLFQAENTGVYLRNRGVSFVQAQVIGEIPKFDFESRLFAENSGQNTSLCKEIQFARHQVDLNFIGTNQDYSVSVYQPSEDYLNYYGSACPEGITGIKTYGKVVYNNIYNGIDVVFNRFNSLKYDFVVHPGANYNEIKLSWVGADSVYLDDENLIIKTQIESIYESIPLVYQLIDGDTIKVEANYRLIHGAAGYNEISFVLGNFDEQHDLIIDPWITNYGGTNIDYGLEVDTDHEGNVFMSGETYSLTAIAEAGFQMINGGGVSDSFLAKFTPVGERIWATFYGGDGGGALSRERGSVAIDSEGNAYLGGPTNSEDAIASPGAFQTSYGGGLFDGFIAKFDPDGVRLWGTYYGGEGEDYAMNVGVDAFDNPYLCGYTFSESDIAADGHQDFFGGFADGFLVKFDPDGNRVWGTYYGGVNAEIIHDVEGDNWGNIYFSGVTTSPDLIATPGVAQDVWGGGQDAFLVKFDQDGNREWGTYYGQLWVERGDCLCPDTAGNVYMAGKTTAPTGSATEDAFQEENGGISDAFLAKYDADGGILWATYVGGELIDYAFGVDVDPITNNVVIAGETQSEDFPVAPCADQAELSGDLNAYVTQFLPNGDLFCSSYLGDEHEEESVLCIKDCWIYVVGSTTGNMSTPGAHQTTPGGEDDAFLGRVHLGSCELTFPDWTEFDQDHEDVTSCTPCNGSATIDIADLCLHPMSLKSYVWSNGYEELYTTAITSTLEGICEGEYWVAVTINCDQTDTFYFDIGNTASITADYTILVDDLSTCVGNTVDFENLSSTVFGEIISNSWSFGDGEGSDLENPNHVYDEPGTYEVVLLVENDSECQDSLVQVIEVHPVYDIVMDTVICEDETFIFPDGESIIVTEATSRTYNLTSVHGCDSSYTINLTSVSSFSEVKSITLNEGDTYTFPDGSGIIVDTDTTQTSILSTGTNCDSIIVTNIFVIPKPEPEINPWLKVPNIFTPGGSDGVNETFYFPAEGVETFACIVTNRWGQEVFRFNSITEEWNGVNAKTGQNCTDGVYFYSYSGTYASGESFQGQGNVQLVRE